MASLEIRGFLAAPLTPFDQNGELNLHIIDKYVDFLLNDNISGVFVSGATGEGLSMTVEERKVLAEAWMIAGNGKLKYIIIQVGAANLKDTKELARHAESINVHAIGILPTLFPRPSNVDCLTRYVKEASDAAPNTPLIYYHLPELTNVTFPMEEFLIHAAKTIPMLTGVKFTSSDLSDLRRCTLLNEGRFQMLFGRDMEYLAAHLLGIKGGIGSTYNYMGRVYNRMVDYSDRGELDNALIEQDRSQALVKILVKYGHHAGVQKAILKLRGLDVGYPRLPVVPLDDEQVVGLKRELEAIGFFQWCL